ncbi:MAG: hypothetical protein GX321_10685, partial [Clostridiales bacterium]|nr:hypothetical protein [Clostridiales bacterium]
MKKIIRLVGVQILAMMISAFSIGDKKKSKTKALYVGFAVFFVIMSGFSFLYSYSIGKLLMMFNITHVLPSLFMAISSVMVLFTTIFKVKGTIFAFKDYDM